MRHVIKTQQYKREHLEALFARASILENGHGTPLAGKVLASLFYEPSTRTRLSFEAAMLRLGGNVLTTENAREFSSAIKGETLEDSIRVVSGYADAIVLRHYEIGAAERASKVSLVPVINAGDGAGQHPTQALLDLYTIEKERGKIDGIRVVLMGDLKNGRTIRSLSYLLGKYDDVHIDFVSSPALKVGSDIKSYLSRHGVSYVESEDVAPLLKDADVVYQTRIQKERFATEEEYRTYKGKYVLTAANTECMKRGAFIMHPLPRVDEITTDLDELPRAAYFRQARYGVLVRMALLEELLGGSK